MVNEINPNTLLVQMRAMAARARGEEQVNESPSGDFGNLLRTAIARVNEQQHQAARLSDAFERGESVNLAEVMVASQKANVAMQAAVQVRNRLVSAYQDIMNMPI